VDIGGCAVGALDRRGWRTILGRAIESGTPHHHVSLNAAKWMAMTADPLLLHAVRSATSIGADGASIVLAARLFGTPLPARVPGCDLAIDLLQDAAVRGWRVALLGASSEVVAEVARRQRERGVRVVLARDGWFGPAEEANVVAAIREARPDLLLVAMGSPRTEHFVARHGDTLAIPLVLGVGGTFDILAGRVRRAPALIGRVGLEGLWRLASEPRRRFRSAVVAPPSFLFSVLLARIRRVPPREIPYRARQLVRRARDATARPPVDGADPEWHRDPSGRGQWPDLPAAAVRVVGGPLDPRPLWDRARLQGVSVAVARSFLRSCPPGWGVHWTSAAEVAFRLVSLARMAEATGAPDLHEAVRSHADWIARHPSLHGSANNHRVAELGALAVAGRALPGTADGGRWAAIARAELPSVLAAQLHPDGGGVEQSLAYLAQVLEWALLARESGVRDLEDPLLRGARFLRAIGDAAGHTPLIGDDDGGRVRIDASADRYPVAVAEAVLAALRASFVPATCRFPDTGLTVLRDRDRMVVVDHGPLGAGLGAHGHADALSCWVHHRGRPVIVSRGTGVYQGDPALRAFGRGTSSHPTLVVAGADQSVAHPHPFLWRTRARAWCEAFDEGSRTVSAAHDGYRSRHGVLHRRTVSLDSDRVILTDRVDGPRPVHVRIVLPIAPALDVAEAGATLTVSDGPRPLARIVPPDGFDVRVVRGGERPSAGWHAVAYGEIVEASAVLLETVVRPGVAVRTEIALV
jgi:exopolysaccharide biosynthesis WecB/TagA/CpsF family protein